MSNLLKIHTFFGNHIYDRHVITLRHKVFLAENTHRIYLCKCGAAWQTSRLGSRSVGFNTNEGFMLAIYTYLPDKDKEPFLDSIKPLISSDFYNTEIQWDLVQDTAPKHSNQERVLLTVRTEVRTRHPLTTSVSALQRPRSVALCLNIRHNAEAIASSD